MKLSATGTPDTLPTSAEPLRRPPVVVPVAAVAPVNAVVRFLCFAGILGNSLGQLHFR